jgi:hypothetical protein
MTTVKLKIEGCSNNLRTSIIVNRRHVRFANRITTLKKVRKDGFVGFANGESFTITGGTHGGGTSREWLLSWAPLTGGTKRPVWVTSVVDAVNIIETV